MAKLYFRYGAMNSGKSTALMQVAHNYEEQGMRVLILKPQVDTKGGALFCLPPSKVIYQLYPTANVFCTIDISVYKTAISSLLSHVVYNSIPSISQ